MADSPIARSSVGPRRARYITPGFLALAPKAFGMEFEIAGGVAPKPFEEEGKVAVITICGPLEQHPTWFWQDYETLQTQAEAAFANPTTTAVALKINSPGGSAAGCFELARALRAMSETSKKTLGVFVDGMAASAAYAIASAATPGFLHAPATSTVASLAVYEMMVDQTASDQMMGLKFLFVPSTGADLKLTGNSHITPSGEMVAHTQGQVDLLTDYFYGLVEEMRGVPQETIRALRGASLLASQGLVNGLVDAVGDWAGFLTSLESSKGTQQMAAQAKAKSPFDDAMAALAEAAKSDDEEVAKKAKKMLAAHYAEETPEGGEPEGDPKPEPAGTSAEETDEEKKAKAEADEEAKKAKAAAAKTGALALASNDVALAAQVHALTVKIAQQEESTARATLLATRPDFSAEVKKTLATASLSVLEHAVKTWPRVNVTPGAAANAAIPGVTPGAADQAGMAGMRADQMALLDRLDRKGSSPAQAKMDGASLILDANMSPDAARARVEAMQKQGLVPKGTPHDMARSDPTTFRASQVLGK